MKKLGLLFICLFFLMPVRIYAVDCRTGVSGTTFTLQESCKYGAVVDGVDAGTGTTNTAKLVVPNGVDMTISDASTFVTGQMQILPGGSVIIPQGSQIIIGSPLWMDDGDSDGYADSTTQTQSRTSPGESAKRKNTITSHLVDCNSADAAKAASCPVDLTAGSFENGKDVNGTGLLQGYYQELGRDPSLVGLWHLNEASGNVADSSGNSNTGVPTGTTVVSGLMSNARSFDGSNDVINVGTAASLDFGNSGAFTFSGWVNPTTAKDYAGFISKDAAGRATSSYSFMTTFMANGRLETHNGSSWADLCAAGSLVTGKWQHVAFVYNGSTMIVTLCKRAVTFSTTPPLDAMRLLSDRLLAQRNRNTLSLIKTCK